MPHPQQQQQQQQLQQLQLDKGRGRGDVDRAVGTVVGGTILSGHDDSNNNHNNSSVNNDDDRGQDDGEPTPLVEVTTSSNGFLASNGPLRVPGSATAPAALAAPNWITSSIAAPEPPLPSTSGLPFRGIYTPAQPPGPAQPLMPHFPSPATGAPSAPIRFACLTCRRRKVKCSGHRPSCNGCAKANVSCVWPLRKKRRKRRRSDEDDEEAGDDEEDLLEELPHRASVDGALVPASSIPGAPTLGGPVRVANWNLSGGLYSPIIRLPPQRSKGGTFASSADQTPPAPSSSQLGRFVPPPPDKHAGFHSSKLPQSRSSPTGGGPQSTHTTDTHGNLSERAWAGIRSGNRLIDQPSHMSSTGSAVADSSSSSSSSSLALTHTDRSNPSSNWPWDTPQPRPSLPIFGDDGLTEAIMRALRAQAQGNANDGDTILQLSYFRVSGTTSLKPGINRITFSMRVDPSGKPAEARGDTPECLGSTSGSCSSTPQTEGGDPFRATPGGGGGSASSSSGAGVRLDPETGLPPEQVWRPLFDLFFVVLGQHFPSISKPILERRIQCGIMSTFFLLAICAITLPYSPLRQELAPNGGNPFVDKANELLVPLLRFPAYDTTTALLLLAWCEFRENYDSGFWQFTGMAIRMAFDLGINTNQDEVYDDGAHAKRTHLLFWTIFIIDRVISFFTGRPVTIAESMCEIPLPVEEEFIGIEGVDSPSLDDLLRRPRQPFPYVVRLMVLCGRLSDALNGLRRGLVAGSLPDSDRTRLVEAAKAVQIDLLHFYETLPLDLAWSTENFKIQAGACQGGLLLMIHLWANALLLLAHKPELLHKMMSDPNIPSLGPRRTFECIKVISDCIVFADLFSSVSLTATPHVCLPLAVAALAFVSELQACNGRLEMSGPQEGGSGRESARTPTFAATSGIASSSLQSLPRPSSSGLNQSTPLLQMDPVDSFRMMMLQQNVSVAVKGLRMMEKYWGAVKAVLTQLAVHCERAGVTGLDFSSDPEETERYICLPDKGILRRFTRNTDRPGSTSTSPVTLPYPAPLQPDPPSAQTSGPVPHQSPLPSQQRKPLGAVPRQTTFLPPPPQLPAFHSNHPSSHHLGAGTALSAPSPRGMAVLDLQTLLMQVSGGDLGGSGGGSVVNGSGGGNHAGF